MRLRAIVSGGQTGVDQAALREAKAMGLATGGWAPKGWRTDSGPAPWLGDEYGLLEHARADYPARTRANAQHSDATAWFGRDSPGKRCTEQACADLGRPFIDNPSPETFSAMAEVYETINCAGNRARTNPSASVAVVAAFAWLKQGRLKL